MSKYEEVIGALECATLATEGNTDKEHRAYCNDAVEAAEEALQTMRETFGDVDVERLVAKLSRAQEDVKQIEGIADTFKAERDQALAENKALRERLNDYVYIRLSHDMKAYRENAYETKNEKIASGFHGAANAYEEVYGVLNEILQEQTLKGNE